MITYRLHYDFSTESTTLRCEKCDTPATQRRYTPLADFTGREMYEWLDKHTRAYHPEFVPKEGWEREAKRWK